MDKGKTLAALPNVIEVENLEREELKPYAGTSEIQLLRYFEPKPGIFIAESPKVIARALDAGYEPISLLIEKRLLESEGQARDIVLRCGAIPIYTANMDVLIRITGYHLTQGMLCAMKRRRLLDAEEICAGASRIAVLEDVVNQTNIGAAFRSAAALGFDAVLLTPDCCDPLYRRSIRVSMGTVFQIPWTFLEASDSGYVKRLQEMGFAVAAMALREDSVGIDDPRLMDEKRLALLLGNEGDGLKAATIDVCDYVVRIPMAHGVDSLNVAAASAVAFWQLRKPEIQQ